MVSSKFAFICDLCRYNRVHKERSAETVCAMKELNPSDHKDRFGATPEEVSLSVGRVASEVEILSRLEHPNIVNYHESFTHGGAVHVESIQLTYSLKAPGFNP
jgi:serine/threonine protein kinase